MGLRLKPSGRELGLEDKIWVLRMGLGLQGWDLGFETGIIAMMLRFGPQDWDLGLKATI